MKKDGVNRTMTRRKFILSLFGVAGSAVVGFGAFDYMKNMKKTFKSDYFIKARFRNIKPIDVMKKGPNLEPVERVIKAAEKNKVKLSLPKPGQLISEKNFIVNSRWWEA